MDPATAIHYRTLARRLAAVAGHLDDSLTLLRKAVAEAPPIILSETDLRTLQARLSDLTYEMLHLTELIETLSPDVQNPPEGEK